MKKLIPLLLILILALGCSTDPATYRTYLDGYWQIDKVVLPGGEERSFRLSPVVDYIELKGDSGVRKKVMPQIDGSFKVNQSAERFKLEITKDSLRMHYSTAYDSWAETVIRAADSTLVVLNSDGKLYYYKKFTTFSIK